MFESHGSTRASNVNMATTLCGGDVPRVAWSCLGCARECALEGRSVVLTVRCASMSESLVSIALYDRLVTEQDRGNDMVVRSPMVTEVRWSNSDASLMKLPEEILDTISGFLDVKSRLCLYGTSRTLRRVCAPLVYAVCLCESWIRHSTEVFRRRVR